MLKSYEAILENGRIKWLAEKPSARSARVIVTILDVPSTAPKKRTPPPHLIGKAKVLGDIVGPIIEEEDWECLK
jgi:hypothetical protein